MRWRKSVRLRWRGRSGRLRRRWRKSVRLQRKGRSGQLCTLALSRARARVMSTNHWRTSTTAPRCLLDDSGSQDREYRMHFRLITFIIKKDIQPMRKLWTEEICKIPNNRFCAGSGMWTHGKKGMFDPVEIDIVMAMKEKWGMKKTKTQYSQMNNSQKNL